MSATHASSRLGCPTRSRLTPIARGGQLGERLARSARRSRRGCSSSAIRTDRTTSVELVVDDERCRRAGARMQRVDQVRQRVQSPGAAHGGLQLAAGAAAISRPPWNDRDAVGRLIDLVEGLRREAVPSFHSSRCRGRSVVVRSRSAGRGRSISSSRNSSPGVTMMLAARSSFPARPPLERPGEPRGRCGAGRGRKAAAVRQPRSLARRGSGRAGGRAAAPYPRR